MRWLPAPVLVAILAGPQAAAQPGTCASSPTWEAFRRCGLKDPRAEVVHELANGKLVRFTSGRARTHRLELYVRRDGLWTRLPFSAEIDATRELLAVRELATDAYRVDVGQAIGLWLTFDQVTTRPALLRRHIAHVCTIRGCVPVMTRCEVLVRGKAIAGYRGELDWDGHSAKLRVDLRAEHPHCASPRNVVVEELGA